MYSTFPHTAPHMQYLVILCITQQLTSFSPSPSLLCSPFSFSLSAAGFSLPPRCMRQTLAYFFWVSAANKKVKFCIARNCHWYKISWKCDQTLQKKFLHFFFFVEQLLDTVTTPLPADRHTPHVNQRKDNEQRSEEVNLCNNGLVFLLCGGLRKYESVKTIAVS